MYEGNTWFKGLLSQVENRLRQRISFVSYLLELPEPRCDEAHIEECTGECEARLELANP
jgi:hypothetical protein